MRLLSKLDLKKHKGETCLLRVDLNVEKEEVGDNFRLRAVIPTIQLLLKKNIRVVLLSHRGRPDGPDGALSLSPFVPFIVKKTKRTVDFIAAYRLGAIEKAVQKSKADIILLENLRFFTGEETDDPSFGKALARLGDFYVNDAFAVSHRKNASVDAITKYIPSYAGLLMEEEVDRLSAVSAKQPHPFLMIIGGAKVSDKLELLERFMKKADVVLVGGGPANTFFASQRFPMGKSLVDWNSIPLVRKLFATGKIVLPVDTVIKKGQVLDIGPATSQLFAGHIRSAKTIIWAGPPGYFAIKGCEEGTRTLWRVILSNTHGRVVVGGGETTAALRKYFKHTKVPSNVFVSTGGGAMLEFLAGKKLPGIEALKH